MPGMGGCSPCRRAGCQGIWGGKWFSFILLHWIHLVRAHAGSGPSYLQQSLTSALACRRKTPASEHLRCTTGHRMPGNRWLPKTSDISCLAPSLQVQSYKSSLAATYDSHTTRSLPKHRWHGCCLLWKSSTLSQLPAIAVMEQKQV